MIETTLERYEQEEALPERPAQEILPGLMSEAQARSAAASIRKNVQRWERTTATLRAQLVDFESRAGYAALGYKTMKACLLPEFGIAESTFRRQLAAAAVEERVGVPVGTLPGSHAETLRALPPEAQKAAYDEAVAAGAAMGRSLQAAVERRILEPDGPPPASKQQPMLARVEGDDEAEEWTVAPAERGWLRENGLDLAAVLALVRLVTERAESGDPKAARVMFCKSLLKEARKST